MVVSPLLDFLDFLDLKHKEFVFKIWADNSRYICNIFFKYRMFMYLFSSIH